MTKREPIYYFVALDVAAEKVDDFSARLFALGADGIEERDAFTIEKGESGKSTLVASFPTQALAVTACATLPKLVKGRMQQLVGDAWRDAWKAYFKPFLLCPEFWISPPWESFSQPEGHKRLVLEPGRAFGTGLHESTALVAQILYRRRTELTGKAVLDVGMGSGILALVALKLGASRARGIDVDPEVVAVARENAERNRFTAHCVFDASPLEKVAETFPIVVANIEADVLMAMRAQLLGHVTSGGLLVLSGILSTRMSEVKEAFLPYAKLVNAMEKGEWVGLAFENTSAAPSLELRRASGPLASSIASDKPVPNKPGANKPLSKKPVPTKHVANKPGGNKPGPRKLDRT